MAVQVETPDSRESSPAWITTTPPGSPAPSIPSPVRHRNFSPDIASSGGGYPRFADGDVLIVDGLGHSWKLHSAALAHASRQFAQIFEEHEGHVIPTKLKTAGKLVRWKLEMIQWEEKPDARFRSFRVVDMTAKKSLTFENINGLGLENGPTHYRIYDNYFRCVYGASPIMPNEQEDKDGSSLILQCVSLLQAAESLQGAQVVRLPIEAHLLRLNQVLWHHVEHNPEAWSDIGLRLQSPLIFREAMVYIIGRWDLKGILAVRKNFLESQDSGTLVTELAIGKAHEMKEKKLNVERRLMEFYPTQMIHAETIEDVPGRAIYATDIYLWQALTLVRQYISCSYMANMHHRAPDGGANFYRCIGASGDAYLRKDTLERFHKSFAMSSKGKVCLAQAIEIIKDSLAPIANELLVDRTQVNRGPKDKPAYLLCAEFLDEELPWNAQAAKTALDRMEE